MGRAFLSTGRGLSWPPRYTFGKMLVVLFQLQKKLVLDEYFGEASALFGQYDWNR